MSHTEVLTANTPDGISGCDSSLEKNPVEGLKKAHSDMIKWCYKSHGSFVEQHLKKLDEASVKREHVVYGLLALTSLYLLGGEQAFFLSALITFTYPAYDSVQVIRSKNSAEALHLLLYWVVFGFFSVLDSTSICGLPAYFLLKSCFLLYLYLPQTQGLKLIHSKAIEPIGKTVDEIAKKFN